MDGSVGRSRTETMSWFFAGVLLRLPAPGPADPDVHVAHRADGAGLDQLDDPSVVVSGVDLGAHLGRHLGLAGGLADDPGLPDAVRQRLLAVDVLAELEARAAWRRRACARSC